MDTGARGAPRAVLVIDDHPLFCDALSTALREGLGLEAVPTANSLGEGLRRLREGLEVEAVALDLNLPDVSGVDGLLRLRAATPKTPVVVVSGMTDNDVIAQAMRAGAAGFVRKDTPRDALVAALGQVLDGYSYTPPDYAPPRVEGSAPADALDRMGELTQQQLRILSLVCEGKLNKQIAYDLSIAETTVKAHITAILRKLGVQSRTQAVLIAQKARYPSTLVGGGRAASH